MALFFKSIDTTYITLVTDILYRVYVGIEESVILLQLEAFVA